MSPSPLFIAEEYAELEKRFLANTAYPPMTGKDLVKLKDILDTEYPCTLQNVTHKELVNKAIELVLDYETMRAAIIANPIAHDRDTLREYDRLRVQLEPDNTAFKKKIDTGLAAQRAGKAAIRGSQLMKTVDKESGELGHSIIHEDD